MPKIAHRGQSMPSSPIRKLVPFANQAKLDGKEVLHLNIGQPDIKTPNVMLEAIRNIDLSIIEYTQSAGNISYRKKLTTYYKKHNININYEDILITTGGSEALLFGLMSCLDPGDEVIIPEPFYANYNGFSHVGNITVCPITSTIKNGFALPSIKEFEKVISPKTKAILICNPNNPTGYLYSEAELLQLKELVLKHDLFLFVDEVYREFVYDDREHVSILSIEGLENNAIIVDSISKRYSACGARIGALVTKNKEIIATALKYAQARLSPPAIEQIAAEASIDVPEQYLIEVKLEYKARRDFIVNELNQIEGVHCPNPGGAFYCIVELPVKNAEQFCKWLLTDFSYNNKTIMLAPAAGFYSSKDLGKNQIRLAYVLKIEKLKQAVQCLKIALDTYKAEENL